MAEPPHPAHELSRQLHQKSGPTRCPDGFRPAIRPPPPVEHPQIQRGAQQRPLRLHIFPTAHGPSPKSVVRFDLAKTRFDDPTALLPLRPNRRVAEPLAHRLHDRGVRPDFHLPAFGVARAVRPHRTVPHVTAIPFNAHPSFGGVPFVIEWPPFWTGDRQRGRVVVEMLRGVGKVLDGLAFGGWVFPLLRVSGSCPDK